VRHPETARFTWSWGALAAAVWLLFAGWCLTADPESGTTTAVVDITETLVPLVAGVLCLSAARRSPNGRLAWGLGGVGVFAWGLGQAVWTYYEVWLGVEVPFPSLADAGYLVFPVATSIGVAFYHASNRRRRAPVATVLEAALLAASLFTISWVVLLQEMVHNGDVASFSSWLSLAYPVGDLVLVAMVLHVVTRLRTAPGSLWLLATGLVVMAVADSAFVWMIEAEKFVTGGWIDLAWITAFALIGVAGLRAHVETDRDDGRIDMTRLAVGLPYIPFTIGMTVIAMRVWTGEAGPMEVVIAGVLVVLLVLRQFLALVDNQRLLVALRSREAELRHLALHDPLTGLANRALLGDRMTHAATRRDDVPVGPTLLLIDLDDFKEINDEHGHAAGDALLVAVAQRLSECVRSHDTVARLGGDEFAILLEPPTDLAEEVAERVLQTVSTVVEVDGRSLLVSASVGIGEVARDGGDESVRVSLAMHEADMAMYAAKASGKGRWRRFGPDVAAIGRPQPQDRSPVTVTATATATLPVPPLAAIPPPRSARRDPRG
jgi:diguanylate cyclase